MRWYCPDPAPCLVFKVLCGGLPEHCFLVQRKNVQPFKHLGNTLGALDILFFDLLQGVIVVQAREYHAAPGIKPNPVP